MSDVVYIRNSVIIRNLVIIRDLVLGRAPTGLKLCANRLWIALVYEMVNTWHVYCILCHHYWMLPKRQKTCSDGAVDVRKRMGMYRLEL